MKLFIFWLILLIPNNLVNCGNISKRSEENDNIIQQINTTQDETSLDYLQTIMINDQTFDLIEHENDRPEFLQISSDDEILLECDDLNENGRQSLRWRLNGEVLRTNQTSISFNPNQPLDFSGTKIDNFNFSCEFYGGSSNHKMVILKFPQLILGKNIFYKQ